MRLAKERKLGKRMALKIKDFCSRLRALVFPISLESLRAPQASFFGRGVLFLAGLLSSTTGCSIYETGFECPAYKGIGCKSVVEVESMIIENKEGSYGFDPSISSEEGPSCQSCEVDNSFWGKKPSGKNKSGAHGVRNVRSQNEIKSLAQAKENQQANRIWVKGESGGQGVHMGPRYVYFSLGEIENERETL